GAEPPAAGTGIGVEHLGHFTFLPAALSGACSRALHDGQAIVIGMDLLPMSARPSSRERPTSSFGVGVGLGDRGGLSGLVLLYRPARPCTTFVDVSFCQTDRPASASLSGTD